MSKTIARGRLFRVTVGINDQLLATMKRAPQVAQVALAAGADYWHTGIMPKHFRKDAHGAYGYAARSARYLKQRGKGTKPDLVFSGSLARDLKAQAQFKNQGSASAAVVELKMRARVLNFVPGKENDDAEYVTHQGGKGRRGKKGAGGGQRRYPNLRREIKAFTDEDRAAVAQVVTAVLERAFGDTTGRESDD